MNKDANENSSKMRFFLILNHVRNHPVKDPIEYTANPKLVKRATFIRNIEYSE